MKRYLTLSLIAFSALAAGTFACSTKTEDTKNNAEPGTNEPGTTDNDAGQTGDTDGGTTTTEAGPKPGSEDPSGNPILLGTPRTVRSFTPAGGEPHFVDGPTWVPAKNEIYVSLPFATNPQGGKGILTSFKPDGTNYLELRAGDKVTTGVVGNSIDQNGDLISAELKVVTRTPAGAGAPVVIAAGYGDPTTPTPFDGPNDLVALADGTIYVTDPGYGVEPRPQVGKLYRIAPAATVATLVDSYDYNPSPNGIAVSKDQKFLYVGFTAPAEGTPPFVRKYTINADRSLTDNGKYFELPVGSAPDGMTMDENDNIYVALKDGIAVYRATGAQGEPYGGANAKIPQTPIAGEPTNVSFGGTDRKSLFVTIKGGKVLELKTKVAGLLQ